MSRLLITLLAMFLPLPVPARAAGVEGKFPQTETESLAGKKYSLPGDFESDVNLVFIAFAREQQKNIDTWLHEEKRLQGLDTRLKIYELPTIARLDSFRRWFINTGMRRGIPDRKARERTLTLYLDKKSFDQSLKISDEKQIYALLVNRAGDVLWRAVGDFDETKAQSLRAALEKLKHE